MDKWLKRHGMSVDAKDLAEAGSSKNPEMGQASVARKKKRMYDESYVQYGFTYSIGNHDEQLPLCLLCNETLAAESMKPTKLEKYLLASYQASYRIAKAKKPYTIGEELVLPTAIQITETIHGKKYADELRKIPLSNDTVAKRISDISSD
ncbi:hypothetical protein CBL_20087, partial [Carabus blaptoides fortunei]